MTEIELRLTVTDICRLFSITRNAYYKWKKAGKAEKAMTSSQKENRALELMIMDIVHQRTYVPGARQLVKEIRRRFGVGVGKARIGKIMKKMGLSPTRSRRSDAYKGQAEAFHPCCAVQNYVNQEFYAGCRSIILTDITYIYYGLEDKCAYLCTFLDPYTHQILGCAVEDTMTSELVKKAWNSMMDKHGDEFPKDSQVYIHSDQGSQYQSAGYKELFNEQVVQSMSRRGNSWDNAPQESFFGTLKERLTPFFPLPRTLEQIREMIFKYISDYNDTPSNVLAGLTPNEYYQYKMTNILPQETYLGVNAESLNDLDSVIRRMREKAGHRRAKKETNNTRTKKYTIDPLSRVQEDMTRLKRKSGSLQKAAAKIMKQVDLIENALLIKVSAAYEYLQKLIEEDPEKYGTFRNPANWSSQPELCYVQEFHKGFN